MLFFGIHCSLNTQSFDTGDLVKYQAYLGATHTSTEGTRSYETCVTARRISTI